MSQVIVVELSEKAISHIAKTATEQKLTTPILRLGVKGGGCSGLSYFMDFSEKKESDIIQDYPQFKVAIDPKSALYLKGVILDYQDGLSGKGLVFQNPVAKNVCGCGESFSV